VMKLMATSFAGALPVTVNGDSPQQPVRGTVFVDIPSAPIGSPTYPLDVLAAFSGDRKTLLISVVNPTEQAQSFSPRFTGVKLRGTGKLQRIAGSSAGAGNEPGKPPAVQIVETPQQALDGAVQVPPASISLYEFEVANA
ncbi:MAG: alpha-N-arabinofuranosidase, partial [Acidobacteriota bacterium]